MLQFTTPPGGVMTREVGAITGDVELTYYPEQRTGMINSVGAREQYVVAGHAPNGWTEADAVGWLQADLGVDEAGNAVATSFEGSDLEGEGRAKRLAQG